jgi:hypothetical protein
LTNANVIEGHTFESGTNNKRDKKDVRPRSWVRLTLSISPLQMAGDSTIMVTLNGKSRREPFPAITVGGEHSDTRAAQSTSAGGSPQNQ